MTTKEKIAILRRRVHGKIMAADQLEIDAERIGDSEARKYWLGYQFAASDIMLIVSDLFPIETNTTGRAS